MLNYTIRRILLIIPTLFLVTVIVFMSIRMIPGDIVDIMVEEMMSTGQGGTADQIDREKVMRKLGMDIPVHVLYVRWMRKIRWGTWE